MKWMKTEENTFYCYNSNVPLKLLCPGGHLLQRLEGGSSPMVPAGHSSGGWLLSKKYFHPFATVTVLAPPVPTMDPAGGNWHRVPFCCVCKYPNGQWSHAVDPVSSVYLPGMHRKQSLLEEVGW
jgi:hypothetical protein